MQALVSLIKAGIGNIIKKKKLIFIVIIYIFIGSGLLFTPFIFS